VSEFPTMSFNEIRERAQYYAASKLLPASLRGKEVEISMILETGQELGLRPQAALRGIRIIEGQIFLSADAMVAAVLRSGAAEYFRLVESSNERAVYETRRRGDPGPQRASFTLDDARTAGLLGDGDDDGDDDAADPSWQRHPRAMLRARARAELARGVYPDVILGCYTEDEAREIVPGALEEGFQPPEPPPADEVGDGIPEDRRADTAEPLRAEIDGATTVQQLELLLARIKALATADREALTDPYLARKRALEARR
jgi:hypothetical protein